MLSLSANEYAKRRCSLLTQVKQNSAIILGSAAICQRNADVEYSYRQDSNFYYLTGFPEPEAVIVLLPGRAEGEYVLFCRDKDSALELWHGKRAGQAGAVAQYGADQAFSISQLDALLPSLLNGREAVYSLMSGVTYQPLQKTIRQAVDCLCSQVKQDVVAPREFIALENLLHEIRLIKSTEELELMQYAMDVSTKAHTRAMQECKEGLFEYHLEAALDYEFKRGGARLVAYNSIVASGSNACILHYQENDAKLMAGDLVMIDAGCEIDCYASDISRTFPVSGRFSEEQKAIYDIVLSANVEAIKKVAPQVLYEEIHYTAVYQITKGLVELGILQGDVDELIKAKAYQDFYMHGTGHWLGLDVHDVGRYRVNGKSRALAVGMVMTIEPGIYIAPDNQHVDEKWRGIGIRIEDNVVVTEQGCRVMTQKMPKTVAEIEELMALNE